MPHSSLKEKLVEAHSLPQRSDPRLSAHRSDRCHATGETLQSTCAQARHQMRKLLPACPGSSLAACHASEDFGGAETLQGQRKTPLSVPFLRMAKHPAAHWSRRRTLAYQKAASYARLDHSTTK